MMIRSKVILASAIIGLGLTSPGQVAPTDGRSMAEPESVAASVHAHIDKITSCIASPVMIKGEQPDCKTLAQRMAFFHVPGVSIAVIHNGTIEWSRGFGVTKTGGAPVTEDTLFQAGSISKPVAALAALYEVQSGKLSLDSDVNSKLTSWKVPDSSAANGKPVTLRELLTHTAGLTVHGFPGYAKGEPVPTLVQVLNGEKPANTPPIRIESEPGSKWNYSGGGYAVMLQLLNDTTKEPFPKLMHDAVLGPIGMVDSTYEQPLPVALQAGAATPYDADGQPIRGGAHTYPEMTAAGLWTTSPDLARFCIEVERSLAGKSNHVLSRKMTEEMLTKGKGNWGLGVEIGGSADDPYFTHGGVNEGFEGLFVAYEKHGDGAVVLTNAQGGIRLANDVMRSIGNEYGWPDFHSAVHTEVKLPAEALRPYVGVYQMSPGVYMMITLSGDQLSSQLTGQRALQLFAEGGDKFFPTDVDAELEFVKDVSGKFTKVVLHQNGRDISMARLSDTDAKRIADATAVRDAIAAQRFKDQKPTPGAKEAIRRGIADILDGKPKYDKMSPGLAAATRKQLPQLKTMFTNFGAIKAVTFRRVEKDGTDVYDVEFEHGSTEWHIFLMPDGTVDRLGFRPL